MMLTDSEKKIWHRYKTTNTIFVSCVAWKMINKGFNDLEGNNNRKSLDDTKYFKWNISLSWAWNYNSFRLTHNGKGLQEPATH